MPLAGGSIGSGTEKDPLVEQVWHSGLPHRRIIGNRMYGGYCPPRGCRLRGYYAPRRYRYYRPYRGYRYRYYRARYRYRPRVYIGIF
jgi:hypothetical protein